MPRSYLKKLQMKQKERKEKQKKTKTKEKKIKENSQIYLDTAVRHIQCAID